MLTNALPCDAVALDALRDYAALFADDFPQGRAAQWVGIYLQGILDGGPRKSVRALSWRVALPDNLVCVDPEQALQQFISQSPWQEHKVWRRYRAELARVLGCPEGIFVLHETAFLKNGKHSVGVERQNCGGSGRKLNCQVAVCLDNVGPRGHCPLELRLFLPDRWLSDQRRLDRAGVPPAERRPLTKPQIALELLDRVRAEGLPGRAVVTDTDYGASAAFRDALAARGLVYLAGVPGDFGACPEALPEVPPCPCRAGPARPPGRQTRANPSLMALFELAKQAELRRVTWPEGGGSLSARFGWLRVWPGQDIQGGVRANAAPLGLLIEQHADRTPSFALSNLPEGTRCTTAVRLWKSCRPVRRCYRQMKQDLGLDHFEGRTWRGFHHHACLVMLAYGFLAMNRRARAAGKALANGQLQYPADSVAD